MSAENESLLELINNQFHSLQIIQQIVRHDLNNALEELDYLVGKWDTTQCQSHGSSCLPSIEKQLQKLRQSADLLSVQEGSEVCVSKVVLPVVVNCDLLPNTKFKEFDGDSVAVDARVLVSVIKNLLDNSKEAYERLHHGLDGLLITMSFQGGLLSIEDNSGGLDPNNVKYGNTTKSKPKGHGQFLSTMVEKSHLFGFSFVIECIPGGTKVTLGFKK